MATQRYHINPTTGETGACRAVNGQCPFGSAEGHHDSPQQARAAFEQQMAGEHLVALSRKVEVMAYAHKHFDDELAPMYGDIPEEHLDKQREKYVSDILANPAAIRELEGLYAPQVEKPLPAGVIPDDTVFTLETASGEQFEGTPRRFRNKFPAGLYHGLRANSETGEDEAVVMTVDSSGGTLLQLSDAAVTRPAFEVPEHPAVVSSRALETRLLSTVSNIRGAADAETDAATLEKASATISSALQKQDFSGERGAARAREELDELQADLNAQGQEADAVGQPRVAAAWWKASESLADTLLARR